VTQPTQPTARSLKCLAALAAVVVVGFGPNLAAAAAEDSGSAPPVPQASPSVMIVEHRYEPASLTVIAGDTVTWTNQDQAQHVIAGTSGPEALQAPSLSQGQSWSHTFGTPGSYSYTCDVHPDMVASLTVNPAPTATMGTTGPTTDLPPLAVAGVVVVIVLGTTLALFGAGPVAAPTAGSDDEALP
jgi:plastocyanin